MTQAIIATESFQHIHTWQAAVLGAVQGLTEFLPVSSTAHLTLVPEVFHWPDPGLAFDVALHIGTLLAVVLYFLPELAGMLASLVGSSGQSSEERASHRHQLALIVIGCMPAGIIGVLLEKKVEGVLRAPIYTALALICVSAIMAWAELRPHGDRKWEGIGIKEALIIGFAQACALVPGVSRSGSTIIAGMFLGLERPAAARFSFLVGMPIIAGSAVWEGRKLLHTPLEPSLFIVGIFVSFVVGYATIAWLLRFVQTRSLWPFIIYRVALGAAILVFMSYLTPPLA